MKIEINVYSLRYNNFVAGLGVFVFLAFAPLLTYNAPQICLYYITAVIALATGIILGGIKKKTHEIETIN